MGKEVSDELAAPPIPDGFDELLRAFWQLRDRAGGSGFGPNPITHGAIVDWQSLYRVELMPYEVDLLFDLDNAALAAMEEKEK
jgi:hypothetical protein